jgi:antitoxin component YwqK of YwqJK toxin-antitoxin module
MKKFYLSIMFLGFVVAAMAGDPQDVNKTDANGKKTGNWKIYGNDKTYAGKGFAADAVAEEGAFQDGKKVGIWKQYFPSGKVKSEIEFKNGRPSGTFKTFYENGQVEEEGTWKNNAYTGGFKRYYENGVVAQEKTFNAAGKTEGKVTYNYPNGKPELVFSSTNGQENGELVRYHPNGDVKEKMNFAGGKADEGSRKEFKMVNPPVDLSKYEKPVKEAKTDVNLTTNDPKKEIKDGYQKLYDDQKRLVQDGEFKGGKLHNGKWYKYDKNGLILKVEIYKNGKYFADGQLDGI